MLSVRTVERVSLGACKKRVCLPRVLMFTMIYDVLCDVHIQINNLSITSPFCLIKVFFGINVYIYKL